MMRQPLAIAQPPLEVKLGLKRQRLQEGNDASGAVVAHPVDWTGFSPQDPMFQDAAPHSDAPNRENDALRRRHHYHLQESR